MFNFTEFQLTHRFHNKLKTTYMNGKANRRIDFLLECLLRVEMDNYFKYMEKDILHPMSLEKKVVRFRYTSWASEGIYIHSVCPTWSVYARTQKISEEKWTVHSKSGKSYAVELAPSATCIPGDPLQPTCTREVSIFMPTYVQVWPTVLWFPKWTLKNPNGHVHATWNAQASTKESIVSGCSQLQSNDESECGHSLICWIMHSSFTRFGVKWYTGYIMTFDPYIRMFQQSYVSPGRSTVYIEIYPHWKPYIRFWFIFTFNVNTFNCPKICDVRCT